MPRCNEPVASEQYADFIFLHNNSSINAIYETLQTECVDIINREYAVVYFPLSQVAPISLEKYSYASIPKLYSLLDTTSMAASGITASLAQPALNTRGENVIIGFIDTGIQYENTLFRNPDGSTRILGIWDQTIQENNGVVIPPSDFLSAFTGEALLYGTEYTEEQINNALASDSPRDIVPSTDTDGHGTFLAGIAAGGQLENGSFSGAAPGCRLGIVKLKPAKEYLREFYNIRPGAVAYQENDIMMGIKYLLILAARYKMPLVVLLGVGTNQGSHDGTSPLCQLIQQLSNSYGLVTVASAGNETGYSHHYLGAINTEESFTDVELRVGEDENGFVTELWARDPELYTVGFLSPTGEQISRIPLVFQNDNRITFLLEKTTITVNYINTETGSGSQLIFIRFQSPTTGIWRIRVYSRLTITGQFHMWLPAHGFLSENTVFLQSNPDTTIMEPGNTQALITVGAYNHVADGIFIHSSRGFTRSGRIKPELTAPGVDVYGPGLYPDAALDFNSPPPMTRKSGTSIAAAHTAGAAALLLSWEYSTGLTDVMNLASIKSYLVRGATRQPYYSYPSKEWGYGQLNLYQTFLSMRE